MKFKVSAFALAFGIWWGGGLFIATWWMIFAGVSPDAVKLLEAVYPGYSISAVGSVAGLVWGFSVTPCAVAFSRCFTTYCPGLLASLKHLSRKADLGLCRGAI